MCAFHKKIRKTTIRLFTKHNSRLENKMVYVSLWKFKSNEKCFSLIKWKCLTYSLNIVLQIVMLRFSGQKQLSKEQKYIWRKIFWIRISTQAKLIFLFKQKKIEQKKKHLPSVNATSNYICVGRKKHCNYGSLSTNWNQF